MQNAAALGVLDHPQRGPVLDGSGRIAVLELGPQPHVRSPILPGSHFGESRCNATKGVLPSASSSES